MTSEHPIIRLKANSPQVIQGQVCPVRKAPLQLDDEVVLCSERDVVVTLAGWREMETAWGGRCPYCRKKVTLPKRPVSPIPRAWRIALLFSGVTLLVVLIFLTSVRSIGKIWTGESTPPDQVTLTDAPTTKPALTYMRTPTPPRPTAAPSAAFTPTTKPALEPTRLLAITGYKNRIAFKSDREGGEALYVMNPDGSDQRRLDDESVYDNAFALEAISPDGKWSLEVMEFDDNVDIYKIDVARTQSYQRITSNAAVDQEPVWAPIDQNHIAFVSTRMGSTDIWTQNIKEPLEEKRLTDNPDYDKHPSWSPDGTQIVYWAVHEGGPRQIWVVNADGSNKRNISNNAYNDWDPIWIKQP